jgi:hypothetical protein
MIYLILVLAYLASLCVAVAVDSSYDTLGKVIQEGTAFRMDIGYSNRK